LIINTDIIQVYTDAPIERILGQKAEVMSRIPILVNANISAEWIEVNFEEGATWPDEHAKLNLFPIADEQYYLQLLYLQYTEEPGRALVYWMEFQPSFFEQYPLSVISSETPFRFDQVTEQQFTICSQSNALLQQLRIEKSYGADGLYQIAATNGSSHTHAAPCAGVYQSSFYRLPGTCLPLSCLR
jgi:hypothetical protein